MLPEWAVLFLATLGLLFFVASSNGQVPRDPPRPLAPGVQELPPAPVDGQPEVADGNIADDNPDVKVQLRGPVHEAFAERVSVDPTPGITVDKKPPTAVDEIPPEVKPEGNNIVWISGYWAWEQQQNDFIWISGVWRATPDGMRWVAGYWAPTQNGGYQWVSGFWSPADMQEVDYAPTPPQSLEQGPNQPAPGDDYFWVPGCYNYNNNNWAWQTGYWSPYQAGYMWMPSRWMWTPRGSIFCRGYWDYPFASRGQLFAPIWLSGNLRARGYRYSPNYGINTGSLGLNLFVNGNLPSYYFGNYYGAGGLGFNPWFQQTRFRGGYDPVFGYNNWYFARQGVNYRDRLAGWHSTFQDNVNLRPAATLADQRVWLKTNANADKAIVSQAVLGRSLSDISGGANAKAFVKLNAEQRTAMANVSQQFRAMGENRLKLEGGARGTTRPGAAGVNANAGAKLKLPEVAHVPGVLDRPVRTLEKPVTGEAGKINRVLPVPRGAKVDGAVNPKVKIDQPDEPRVNPRNPVEPKVDPRLPIEPKVNPRLPVEPKVDPKLPIAPKVNPQPRIEPKSPVEPKVAPKLPREPKVAPKLPVANPKPSNPPPRTGGGNKGGGGGNKGGKGDGKGRD